MRGHGYQSFSSSACKNVWCNGKQPYNVVKPLCDRTLNDLNWSCMRWGKPLDVLNFYSQMQTYGARPPDARTFVAILKECGVLQDLEMGQRVHTHITEVGSEKDNRFVGSTLVDMYAKCHSLPDAKRVFESLQERDVVVWTALLGGYVECGDAEKALFCFEEMQREGISPNCITYICTLKACAITNKVYKALEIHMEIEREGVLEKNLSLGNCLIDLYAKFGYFSKATEILERLPIRDVISWTALARGYLEYLCNEEALQCLDRMRECGVSANPVSLLCELQACGNMRALDKGRHIHAETERYGWLRKDGIVDNALIDMYGKCGSLLDARQVFDMLLVKSKVSWSILITSYTDNGLADEAIHLFREMQLMGISPDTVMYTCCLKACGSIGALIEGQKVHAEIARRGLLNAVAVGNAVLDMYGKCHAVSKAEEIFESFSVRNLVTWNALLHGYIEGGHPLKAIRHFEKMQLEGIDADAVTFVGGLKSCRELGIIDKGLEIHADIVRVGSFEGNLVVGNTLVDMYAGCGLVNRARQVFDMLPARNIITWNALMSGYVEYGSNEEVINCLEQMRSDGIFPDVITYMCILKACSNLAATEKIMEIHEELERRSLLKGNVDLSNTLIDSYAKCGHLEMACCLFKCLEVSDPATWNALIAGYVEHGQDEMALKCFAQMEYGGIMADSITLICILKALGNLGLVGQGEEIHAEIERRGLLCKSINVGSSLIDMYAKCGCIARAQTVFDKLTLRGVISWTALMAGYAQLGQSQSVFALFEKMVEDMIKPDIVTFVILLTVCSRTGLFNKSQMYFEAMNQGYGILPQIEHQVCLLDVLGRLGELEKALAVLEKLSVCSNLVAWHAVLSACRASGNPELGKQAFEQARSSDSCNAYFNHWMGLISLN